METYFKAEHLLVILTLLLLIETCSFWFQYVELLITRKKAAAQPTLFSRPCGQLVGLCPTCLFYSLRHGRLGLIEVSPFILLFTKVFPLVTIVLPFGHQCLSLWSPRSINLVTKGFPFGHQGSTSPFTFF